MAEKKQPDKPYEIPKPKGHPEVKPTRERGEKIPKEIEPGKTPGDDPFEIKPPSEIQEPEEKYS